MFKAVVLTAECVLGDYLTHKLLALVYMPQSCSLALIHTHTHASIHAHAHTDGFK